MRRRFATVALLACSSFVATISPGCGDSQFSGDAGDASTQDVTSSDAANDDGPSTGDSSSSCGASPAAPETFATPTISPDIVATNGVDVYWSGTGYIERGRIGDPMPVTSELVATRLIQIVELAASSGNICWIEDPSQHLLKCAAIASIGDGGLGDSGITKYSDTARRLLGRPSDFLFLRTDLEHLAPPSAPSSLLFVAPLMYTSSPPDIALVQFTDAGAEGFYEITDTHNPGAGVGTPFYVDPGVPGAIAMDSTDVVFTHVADQTVVREPLIGGSPSTIAMNQAGLGQIAIDKGNVYFITGSGIMRVAKDGTCLTQITTSVAQNFAITGAYVYYASGGNILRSLK